MSRKFPRKIKRIVVKIGSSSIADYTFKTRTAELRSLVKQLCEVREENVEVILVSSGAIVLGMGELNILTSKGDMASLQALAAIGQTLLMSTYYNLFSKFDTKCAQVLLTWDDFDDRVRRNNAKKTLQAILKRDCIPVINENDTISTDEIKFGDNDKLSAFVASLMHADLLLILSDVEGLYSYKNGKKEVYKEVKEITKEIAKVAAGPQKGKMSKGGMTAKIEAIEMAAHAKVPCVIANCHTKDVVKRVLNGEQIGTLFVEKEDHLLSRKHWISFVAKPKGSIFVDDGAKQALLKGGVSLLLPGVIKVEGHFKPKDVVVVCDSKNAEIARGIVNYYHSKLDILTTHKDKRGHPEVIHCDNLVLCKR